jgi:hypothetical protein
MLGVIPILNLHFVEQFSIAFTQDPAQMKYWVGLFY